MKFHQLTPKGNVMFPNLISYKEIHRHEHHNRERVAKHDADPTRGMDPADVAIRSTEGKQEEVKCAVKQNW